MAPNHDPQNPNPLSFIFFFLLFLLLLSSSSSPSMASSDPLISFLVRLQSEALATLGPKNFDPKLYVDLPLKTDLSAAESAFARLPRSPEGAILAPVLGMFLDEYFDEAGSDLAYVEPVDFVPEPEGFLPNVENPRVRSWALEVHSLWKDLSRRVADEVRERPERHTLLPLPSPVIVPGSRFREVYYWDSYWIVRGLLVSKMYDTAKGIVNNLISLIETYGHVLNGARTYYSNRSQPPLLSSMVYDIYMRTQDLEFVKKAFPSLLKEHSFWVSDVHKVTIRDVQGHEHSLCRYQAMWNKPRPESATIDEQSASKLSTASQKENFFRQLASGAESGWDFSSRWMSNSSDLTTLATTSIIPVDLNTFIYKMELDISVFAKLVGDNSTSEKFLKASKERRAAIRSIFWNSSMKQWLDYWLISKNNCEEVYNWQADYHNHNVFASNFIPLWVKAYDSAEEVLESLQRSGLIQEVGITTSLSNTGQQWDFPNGWAPLQHLIVEGLAYSGSKEAKSVAEDIAIRWIRTNYAAYRITGAMHEKYDVTECGKPGGGGEYKPQTGFGWSNGVVLAFLEAFGWPHDKEIDC
ncbi:probable trehalase isoform X1 [Ananas comosus]|uniref:Trehalase n=1 Tax=Ananas comosus TaxID=4615 RepID=A0A6P5FBR3_ANACO|nr:probable trehalase isoform X1 [Ananas comosus]